MRGDKIDIKALLPAPAPPGNKPRGYEIVGGVAVIPVEGVLTKSRSFFSFLFGGTSMRDIGDAYEAALADTAIHSIILAIDSPGGTVDGTQELVTRIASRRDEKPVAAWAGGTMASAAYWIGAAAGRIYVGDDTTEVGSIGVVATHIDYSAQDEKYGERWTEITAGAYKRIASIHAPLTAEGRSYIQDQVDYLYGVFVESVAQLRGKPLDEILAAADGKIFIGQQAVDVGLADKIMTLKETINEMEEVHSMDMQQLEAKHPDLVQAIIDKHKPGLIQEGHEQGREQGYQAGLEEGLAKGKETERKRIAEITALASPGNEAIVAAAVADGQSTAGEVAQRIVIADKARQAEMAVAIAATAIPPLPDPPAPEAEPAETYETAVAGLVATGITRGQAMARVAREKPALHAEYLRRVNARQ
jgi:signal peptide peptidase SppA